MKKKNIDVCLTRELLHLYELDNKIVVIIDIFRATSCIVTGLAKGVKKFVPVANAQECLSLQSQGMIAAGEHLGKKIDGFDIGNSPMSYIEKSDFLKGKSVAITTTNGVKAIQQSLHAKEILIGAFLNFQTIVDYIEKQDLDVLLLAAGWRGHFNLEDTLFAGAVVDAVQQQLSFEMNTDSAWAALAIYQQAKGQLDTFIKKAAHYKRLINFNAIQDTKFALRFNVFDVLPKYQNGCIVKASTELEQKTNLQEH